jgi:hypothetical protein
VIRRGIFPVIIIVKRLSGQRIERFTWLTTRRGLGNFIAGLKEDVTHGCSGRIVSEDICALSIQFICVPHAGTAIRTFTSTSRELTLEVHLRALDFSDNDFLFSRGNDSTLGDLL